MRKSFTQSLGRQILSLALVAFGTFALQAQLTLEITAPSSIAGTYEIGTANYGGNANPAIVGELKATEDASANPTFACEALTNDLTGFIAVSDRGACNFSIKAFNAQNAGAIAAILCNNVDEVQNMAAGDFADQVTIPHVIVSSSNCQAIKGAMENGTVEARMFFDNYGFDDVLWGDGADGADFSDTFDVNGFSTVSITPGDTALWTWAADPVTDGSCGSFRIQSPTANNGAVFMDADGLLSGGGAFPCGNNGVAPVTSELISPVIDCSNFAAVAVRWWEFNLPITVGESDGENGTNLQYSLDGGATWSAPMNVSPGSQQGTGGNFYNNAERKVMVIADAAGSENFRFKFQYNRARGYYNWMVDDVALIEPPSYDWEMEGAFYAPLSYVTPVNHISTDTFGFQAYVRNGGIEGDAEFVTRVEIVDPNGNAVHSQEDRRFIPALTRDTVTFNGFSLPAGPLGQYSLNYTCFMEGVVDEIPGDDAVSFDFYLTGNKFAKEALETDEIVSTTTAAFDPWYWGAFYTISELADSDNDGFRGIDLACGATDGTLDGENFVIYLMKWEDTNDQYPDFAGELNMPGTSPLDHPFLTIEAFTPVDPTGLANNELFSLNVEDGVWLDEIGTPITEFTFEPGATYLFLGEFNGDVIGFSSGSSLNLAGSPGVLQNYQGGGEYFTGFVSTYPILRLRMENPAVGSEEVELTEIQANVYPTLTNDIVNVELNFDETVETDVMITDMQGRVVDYARLGEVSKNEFKFDVTNYAVGNYIMTIQSELGVKQQQITVVK